jgi:predicted HicB family RNase H-like nuclease
MSKSEQKNTKATIIRLKSSTHKALRIAAIEDGITMNDAVATAVELWLKQRARKKTTKGETK